jgi:hypothetical protein
MPIISGSYRIKQIPYHDKHSNTNKENITMISNLIRALPIYCHGNKKTVKLTTKSFIILPVATLKDKEKAK